MSCCLYCCQTPLNFLKLLTVFTSVLQSQNILGQTVIKKGESGIHGGKNYGSFFLTCGHPILCACGGHRPQRVLAAALQPNPRNVPPTTIQQSASSLCHRSCRCACVQRKPLRYLTRPLPCPRQLLAVAIAKQPAEEYAFACVIACCRYGSSVVEFCDVHPRAALLIPSTNDFLHCSRKFVAFRAWQPIPFLPHL